MQITQDQISSIVNEVVAEIKKRGSSIEPSSRSSGYIADGVFPTIDEAVGAARKSYNEWRETPVLTRIRVIEGVRQAMRDNVQILAKMAVEEAGIGRAADKVIKNLLVINKTPGVEHMQTHAFTNDFGLILIERAPWGVIGSITPTTNPTETIINNGIGFLAAGNTGVFNPHPSAKGVSAHCIRLINRAAVAMGGPANLLTAVATPTIESANGLMKHPGIDLIVVTGGPAVVKAAFASGKKVICGGPGNPPSVVDDTAHIEKAGRDIVNGHSFDNNIICTDEKEVVVVDKVADQLIESMRAAGAYMINRTQAEKLTNLVLSDKGKPGCGGHANKNFVGKNANLLLREIGINVNDDVKCVLAEVDNDHPLVWTEQLMPFLPVTRVKDVDAAIALAVAAEQNCRHTASMHGMNVEKLSKMARAFEGSIFVKNAPNYAGLGEGGAGYTSFTIASPTGDGLTTCLTFSRERRCALVDYFRIV